MSTINIFVGANNSGKSRLVRALYQSKLVGAYNNANPREIFTQIEELKNEVVRVLNSRFRPNQYCASQLEKLGTIHFRSILIDEETRVFSDAVVNSLNLLESGIRDFHDSITKGGSVRIEVD